MFYFQSKIVLTIKEDLSSMLRKMLELTSDLTHHLKDVSYLKHKSTHGKDIRKGFLKLGGSLLLLIFYYLVVWTAELNCGKCIRKEDVYEHIMVIVKL